MCSHNQEDNLLKQEKRIYKINVFLFFSGLIFGLIYFYIDYKHNENGNIIMIAGAILLLHGMLIKSNLSEIQYYTTHNIDGKNFLVKREVLNTFNIQKKWSFLYIFVGTVISVFAKLLYTYIPIYF